MPNRRDIELHLQEGFAGETVEITLDGASVARVEARTRMQTGLACVERLQAQAGQVLVLTCTRHGATARLTLDGASGFVVANLAGGTLRLVHPKEPPRYA